MRRRSLWLAFRHKTSRHLIWEDLQDSKQSPLWRPANLCGWSSITLIEPGWLFDRTTRQWQMSHKAIKLRQDPSLLGPNESPRVSNHATDPQSFKLSASTVCQLYDVWKYIRNCSSADGQALRLQTRAGERRQRSPPELEWLCETVNATTKKKKLLFFSFFLGLPCKERYVPCCQFHQMR